MPYIQKRLGYIFTEYGVEYYNPGQVILQDMVYHSDNGYKGCMFRDFHDYKIISISGDTTDIDSYYEFLIYMPVFFNFPKT